MGPEGPALSFPARSEAFCHGAWRMSKRDKRNQQRPSRLREKVPFGLRIPHLLSVLILCAAALLVYSNSFESPFHLDDYSSIVWNGAIHDIHNPQAVWDYSPTRFVTYELFALNYYLGALDVVGYHVLNIATHIGAGLAAWWLILLTFRTPALSDGPLSRHSRLVALFAALILVVHPVQTQAVTYIVQRAASLATAFYLLSLALYVEGRLHQVRGKRGSYLFFIAAAVAGVIALFSKETAVTLPAAMVLYELFFFPGRSRSSIFILASIIALFVVLFVLSFVYGLFPIPEVEHITRGQYLITEFRVLVTYLRLLILPVNQNVDYDFPLSKSIFEAGTLLSLVLLLSVLALGLYLFRRHRLLSFGIFWFFLTLMPESSIVPIQDVIYEHRLYLPMLGYSVFVVAGLSLLLLERSRLVLLLTLTTVTCAYAVAAYARNKVWQDELTLTSDIVSKSPHKARAYSSRGYIYIKRGDLQSAVRDLNEAVALDSSFFDAYLNRGIAYGMQRDFAKALNDFNTALRLDSTDTRVLTNRANVYMEEGDFVKAIQDMNRALALDPENALALTNRGLLYSRLGQYARAIADFNEALRLNPGLLEAYYNRSLAYSKSGQRELALRDVARMQELGYRVSQEFIDMLTK
jgi:tetratricopeptide (TPR) repeat protein